MTNTIWVESFIKLKWGNPIEVRTDGVRWQIADSKEVPQCDGKVVDYIARLKELSEGLDDAVMEFGSSEVLMVGWRDMSAGEKTQLLKD